MYKLIDRCHTVEREESEEEESRKLLTDVSPATTADSAMCMRLAG